MTSDLTASTNDRFARQKRSIRNGRLGEIKGQDDLKAMGFGPLQSDAQGGMTEELSCLRRHRRPGNIAEVRRPQLWMGSASIRG